MGKSIDGKSTELKICLRLEGSPMEIEMTAEEAKIVWSKLDKLFRSESEKVYVFPPAVPLYLRPPEYTPPYIVTCTSGTTNC